MVAVKFWACSKQSHKGCRGGRSLTGCSNEAGGTPWLQNGYTGVGHSSPHKIFRIVVNIVCQFQRCLCLACITTVPPLRPLSGRFGDICASIRRPRQPLSHHDNASASTLPPLHDLLCHYSGFGGSGNAQGLCCSSYTEAELSGFGWALSVLVNFQVAQRSRWHEGRSSA